MPEIEKDVHMEADKYGRAAPGRPVYPEFRSMEVGDSVFFPNEPKGSKSNPGVGAHIYGARSGKKFSCRKSCGGVRIWRIA